MKNKIIKMSGGKALMEALLEEKVKHIFGYPGGAIMPIYDALYDYRDRLSHILVRHEQGAAHAAEGYANITGKVGVVFATSGPGATNLVTGIADAMMDSIPLVCITGQVAAQFLGTDAFQEADIIGITTPITKWNHQIINAMEIPEIIAKAFHIARTGRPGPVLIDITKNAQVEECDFSYSKKINLPGYKPKLRIKDEQIVSALKLINMAKKPYLLIGHGVAIAKAEKELLAFIEKTGIPSASTLLGLSVLPSTHPLFVGMLGMHGNYGANVLTNQADVIIAVGMRFDDRVTGRLKDYAKQAKIIHIDIDHAEHQKNVKANISIIADAKNAINALLPKVKKRNHTAWLNEFKKADKIEFKKVISKDINAEIDGSLTMSRVIHLLSRKTHGEAVIVSDVGQHQMITARYYKFAKNNSFITSGGLGTMGYALPSAMGVKVGAPHREVIAIIGDGSFQMNIQELATIAQEKIPVKIIILNNNFLGMVRQWQQMFFAKRYSFVNMQNPDFVAVAKGFGINGEDVNNEVELESAFVAMLKSTKPYLLNIQVKTEFNIFPMMPPGASVDEMRLE